MRATAFMIVVVAALAGAAIGQEDRAMQLTAERIEALAAHLQSDSEHLPGNSTVRGLALLLRDAGCDTDYPTVMGDIGQAFIIQGAQYADNLTDGEPDIGWWPLDRWHIEGRLPALSEMYGCALEYRGTDPDTVRADPAGSYHRLFEPTVRTEIAAERPLMAFWSDPLLVTGHDSIEPPLTGWCLWGNDPEPQDSRLNHYPYAICTYAGRSEPMNRLDADVVALRHAVDLGRGRVAAPGRWVTGPPAWESWERHVLERAADSQARWHANMRGQLLVNRRCAIPYLNALAPRHDEGVAEHLREAVDMYRQQIDVVESMDISHEAIVDPGRGRSELASAIRDAATLDALAIDALERAVQAMRD